MRRFIPILIVILLGYNSANGQCNPAFSQSVNQAAGTFQAVVTAQGVVHSWKFGDGGSGFGATVSHTYQSAGTFLVTHIITDSVTSCRDSLQQSIVITQTCSASFTSVRDSLVQHQYNFMSTSQATGATVQTHSWKINNVQVSIAPSFSRVLSPGLNTVCLTITTTSGCTSSSCHTINVTNQCNTSASFTYTASPANPRTIAFNGNPSGGYSQAWNFGDGHSSSQHSPTHTYSSPGTYQVRLVVRDTLAGCTDTIQRPVIVHTSPADSCTLSISWNTTPANGGINVNLSALSNQSIVSYNWIVYSTPQNFTSSIANPVYWTAGSGIRKVCLTAITNSGCQRQVCDSLLLPAMPPVDSLSGKVLSYPNPATNDVSLRVDLSRATKISLNVYSSQGIIVATLQKDGVPGINVVNVPVQSLQKGQYFIELKYGNRRQRSTFQKY